MKPSSQNTLAELHIRVQRARGTRQPRDGPATQNPSGGGVSESYTCDSGKAVYAAISSCDISISRARTSLL